MLIDKAMLDSITARTGLKLATCLDLLSAGWTYTETVDKPGRWEAPATLRKE
ncbi:MAG: hypothetical protein JWO15_3522 [Sphingomonadales bacterium]|nr:hypothetical protein [Sphingomonadales bacterium]